MDEPGVSKASFRSYWICFLSLLKNLHENKIFRCIDISYARKTQAILDPITKYRLRFICIILFRQQSFQLLLAIASAANFNIQFWQTRKYLTLPSLLRLRIPLRFLPHPHPGQKLPPDSALLLHLAPSQEALPFPPGTPPWKAFPPKQPESPSLC